MLPARPPWRALIARIAPTILCMEAIFALSSRSTLPKPHMIRSDIFAVMGHFGAYLSLGVTLWWMLGMGRLTMRSRALIAWAVAVLYGVSDEFHQSFVPYRTPDVRDILVDAIGAAIGIGIAMFIARRHALREDSADATR